MRRGSGNLIQDDMSQEEPTRKSKVMAEAECAGQPVKGELYLKPVIFCLGLAGCYSFQQRKHLFTEIRCRSLMELTILFYMMGLSAAVLTVMSITAAEVHEAAHAPLDMLYKANVETISLEKATQLNLFISKLTGTQVGFTTCGLLTITKEFILTIAGVFISYFAVLHTTM